MLYWSLSIESKMFKWYAILLLHTGQQNCSALGLFSWTCGYRAVSVGSWSWSEYRRWCESALFHGTFQKSYTASVNVIASNPPSPPSNAFISAVNAWHQFYVVKCLDSRYFVIHCISSWWSYLPCYIIPGMLDSSSYSSICWERKNCQILNIQRSSVELCEPEWLYATTLRCI